MNGTCYFCGARLVLRKSSLLPNPDAAKHLDECWVYRMDRRRDIEASSQSGRDVTVR